MAAAFQTTMTAQGVLAKRMRGLGRIEGSNAEHCPSCLLIPTVLVI